MCHKMSPADILIKTKCFDKCMADGYQIAFINVKDRTCRCNNDFDNSQYENSLNATEALDLLKKSEGLVGIHELACMRN